jgi:hypothetical protein
MTWWGIHPAISPQVPCKSKCQHRFSLLVFIGCSSGSNSGLGWASRLLWCLLILSWTTLLKWGTMKSVYKVWFITYRGAFAVVLRILDWDLCMMTMLDLLAQPTVLFRSSISVWLPLCSFEKSVFYRQMELFPISQLISFVFESICFLFLALCSFQLNVQSKFSPRYFTTSVWGVTVWVMLTGGQWFFRRVNVMRYNLDSLTLIFHFFSYFSMMWKCSWRLSEAIVVSSWVANIAVCPRKCLI